MKKTCKNREVNHWLIKHSTCFCVSSVAVHLGDEFYIVVYEVDLDDISSKKKISLLPKGKCFEKTSIYMNRIFLHKM